MGVVSSIGYDKWPKQGRHVGWRTEVCFGYQTENTIGGTIVRDDMEAPFRTIIKLDDGRYVLSVECQYSYPEPPPKESS